MHYKDSLIIFLIGLVIFTIGLSPEFTGFDCRFAVFAQEMLRNGPTFFPTTYGQPYPDYPGTSTFIIYLFSLLFGKVTPFTLTLPNAIISSLILVYIYKIGAIQSRRWGLFAVLITLFTQEFISISRSSSTDIYTTLATVLCFYIAYSADFYNKQKRLWLVPFILILSFCFRGPIGLVIPSAVICVYFLYNRDFKKFTIIASVSAILLAVCCILLVAAAKYQGGEAFAQKVIENQITGRVGGDAKHWIGYYFSESFARYAISYPFAIFVIIALYKTIFKPENSNHKLLSSLVIWILVVLVGMSIPNTKKIRYVLPIIPAASLVAAYMFTGIFQNSFLLKLRKMFLQFCSGFPFVTVVIIAALWAASGKNEVLSKIPFLILIAITSVLAAEVWILNKKYKDLDKKDLAFTTIGVITFLVIIIGINDPITYYRNSTKPFVTKVETLRLQNHDKLVFYKIYPDSEAIKFIANLNEPLKPEFISNAMDISELHIPAYFVAIKSDFEALPINIAQKIKKLDTGQIGRDDCVVFTYQK